MMFDWLILGEAFFNGYFLLYETETILFALCIFLVYFMIFLVGTEHFLLLFSNTLY